jgi:hypothetical protein
MVQVARVRTGALALPATEAADDAGPVVFTVAGTTFASLSADGGSVLLHLPEAAVDEVAAEHPAAERVESAVGTVGTGIAVIGLPVAGLDVRDLDRLLRRAWDAAAPEGLRAEHDPAATAARTAGLPAIGRPATRALDLAGITTLDAVAARTEAELLALHGVGPRALRILREALAAEGRGLRSG